MTLKDTQDTLEKENTITAHKMSHDLHFSEKSWHILCIVCSFSMRVAKYAFFFENIQTAHKL